MMEDIEDPTVELLFGSPETHVAILCSNGNWLSSRSLSKGQGTMSASEAAGVLSARSPVITPDSTFKLLVSNATGATYRIQLHVGLYLSFEGLDLKLVANIDDAALWDVQALPQSKGFVISACSDVGGWSGPRLWIDKASGQLALSAAGLSVRVDNVFQVLVGPFVYGSIAPCGIKDGATNLGKIALFSPMVGWVSAREGQKNWLGKETGFHLESRYDELNDWECFGMQILRDAAPAPFPAEALLQLNRTGSSVACGSSDGGAGFDGDAADPTPAVVTLKSHHNRFIAADKDVGMALMGNRTEPREWERFEVVPTSDPSSAIDSLSTTSVAIALRSHHNTYVSGLDKHVHAKATEMTAAETFYLVSVDEARKHYWRSNPTPGKSYAAASGRHKKLTNAEIAGISVAATLGVGLLATGIALAVMASQKTDEKNRADNAEKALATATAASAGAPAPAPAAATDPTPSPDPASAASETWLDREEKSNSVPLDVKGYKLRLAFEKRWLLLPSFGTDRADMTYVVHRALQECEAEERRRPGGPKWMSVDEWRTLGSYVQSLHEVRKGQHRSVVSMGPEWSGYFAVPPVTKIFKAAMAD